MSIFYKVGKELMISVMTYQVFLATMFSIKDMKINKFIKKKLKRDRVRSKVNSQSKRYQI
jgi:hypothetical protein